LKELLVGKKKAQSGFFGQMGIYVLYDKFEQTDPNWSIGINI